MVQEIQRAYNETEFLEYVLRTLIKNQESLKIVKQIDEQGVLYNVEIDTTDMPQVIGKQGKTINALRKVFNVVGHLNGVRATLKVNAMK